MARRIYDFKCPDEHITEEYIDSEIKSTDCKICGAKTKRLISPVKSHLDVASGDFPGATMKWARDHEKGATH
jgi:hypothetical protein